MPHGRDPTDHLDRLSAHGREGRPQRFVTCRQRAQTRRRRIEVEHTTHAQRGRHVIDGVAWIELVEEPQALLGERERQWATARDWPWRRHGLTERVVLQAHDLLSQLGDGWRLEQAAQGQLDLEGLAHTRDELSPE